MTDTGISPALQAAMESLAPPTPKTVRVVYVGPFAGGVEVADTGQWANHGEPVEVSEEIAGRPPKGKAEDAGYDPGAGLLAQTENWAKPGTKAAKAVASEEPTNG